MTDKPQDTYAQDAEKEQALAVTMNKITEEQLLLSEKVGALKAFDFVQKLLTVSSIKMLAEIKESKEYKGLKVFDANGKLLTVSSWPQFCEYIGCSFQHVDESIKNLSSFGEEFLETSQRMGVGYRELRKLRKLPEDERDEIINGEAVEKQDKERLLETIEDMTAKHLKTKESLEKQLKDAKADNKATDRVISDKDAKINELSKQLAKKENASPMDRATEYAQQISMIETDAMRVIGDLDKVFQSIANDDTLPDILRINQGKALIAIKSWCNRLIDENGLEDVSDADDGLDWLAAVKAEQEVSEA